MKYLLKVLLCLFLLSCNREQLPKPLTPEMLLSQFFLINGSSDTTLHTLHGAIIKISAGSFSIAGEVEIEVKEAFTALEILASGMLTESNGRPLRSGGMIYINAKTRGNVIELLKPINVSIPNNYYDSAMQVFKGIETDSGTINWTAPYPVDSSFQMKNWGLGKIMFESKCASCHILGKDVIAPNLAGIEERIPDRKRILQFVNNPIKLIHSDPYFLCLKQQYGSVMTSYPEFTSQDIDLLLNYINTEVAKNPSLKTPVKPCDLSADISSSGIASSPCGNDTVYQAQHKNDITILAEEVAVTNTDVMARRSVLQPKELEYLRQGFTDPNATSGMYDFEIRTLGWYNIDAFVEGYEGTTNVKLWASLYIEFDINMKVYLFCPDKKMLSVGQSIDTKKYYFDKIDGGIPLFKSDRAILFAFGSKDDKMYYGINEFIIQEEQAINIAIKETTEKELRQLLSSKAIDGIDVGIEKKETKIIPRICDEDTSLL